MLPALGAIPMVTGLLNSGMDLLKGGMDLAKGGMDLANNAMNTPGKGEKIDWQAHQPQNQIKF